jgi:hypothetical protein
VFFLGKIKGHLSRLAENLEVLDEAIATARKMSKPAGRKAVDKAAALQWTKTLRDLVEVRNSTLLNIKAHLLGRDETGTPNEPADVYDEGSRPQVEYERYFRSELAPWSLQDLKLKCQDCGVESEDVSGRQGHYSNQKDLDLCAGCLEKRQAKGEEYDE